MTLVWQILVWIGLISLALITWLGLSGPLILAVLAWIWGIFQGFHSLTPSRLLLLTLIAGGLELLDYGLTFVFTRLTGAEKRSSWAAVVGGLLGTILGGELFFLIGAVGGMLAGAYLGAYWSERSLGKPAEQARKSALSAVAGNLTARALKSMATLLMGWWLIQWVW